MNDSNFTIAFKTRATTVKMAWKMAYDNIKKNVNITIILSFLSLNTLVFKLLDTAFLTYKFTKNI